MADKVSFLMRN